MTKILDSIDLPYRVGDFVRILSNDFEEGGKLARVIGVCYEFGGCVIDDRRTVARSFGFHKHEIEVALLADPDETTIYKPHDLEAVSPEAAQAAA